jgi:hypothetical protein
MYRKNPLGNKTCKPWIVLCFCQGLERLGGTPKPNSSMKSLHVDILLETGVAKINSNSHSGQKLISEDLSRDPGEYPPNKRTRRLITPL